MSRSSLLGGNAETRSVSTSCRVTTRSTRAHCTTWSIRRFISQYSALGFSGSNASGELILEDSEWSYNGAGIIPNTLDGQRHAPQRGAVIRNNVIHSNGNIQTPAIGYTGAVIGMGVGIAGGNNNVVEGNEVYGSSQWGIVIFPLPDDSFWMANNNIVRDNILRHNGSGDQAEDEVFGYADLAIAASAGEGNCFEDNDYVTSAPPAIEDAFACDAASLGAIIGAGDPRTGASLARDDVNWSTGNHDRSNYSFEDMPEPGPQESMGTMVGHDTADDGDDQPLAGPDAPASLPATGAGALFALFGVALVASTVAVRRRI